MKQIKRNMIQMMIINHDMETYDESYKTPGGEIVHAFGRYGYDS